MLILISRFIKYLDTVQEKDGGFGSLFATSLAIQAKLSTKVKAEFDMDAAWMNLKTSQKPDGSFGHSVTFTGEKCSINVSIFFSFNNVGKGRLLSLGALVQLNEFPLCIDNMYYQSTCSIIEGISDITNIYRSML